tara:strand:- start:4861 stop:6501 length:1641 start_codon:yes stop_codon:yes gene_type:complete
MENIDQSIKYYSNNAINILIYNDINADSKKIINLLFAGMNVKDIKTDEELYPHLKSLGISKNIYDYKTDNDNSLKTINNINIHTVNNISTLTTSIFDLLIINSSNKDISNDILNKYINNISNVIIVANKFEYNVPNSTWSINNNSTHSVLRYDTSIYKPPLRDTICNYYELMHITNNIIDTNKFFLIKSSCIGCIRNRSHIVYCNTIHICMNNNDKSQVLQSESKFNRYNISVIENIDENYVLLRLKDIASLKIHFYENNNEQLIIRNGKERSIYISELGKLSKYKYGPIIVNSLEFPFDYLKRLYGINVFNELKHDNVIIRIPKYLYDCYYNQWSSYTSEYWKNKQIENMYKVYNVLKNNNITCWIDCGTLLGAARNGNVCLFDDDTDIGIFHNDLNLCHTVLHRNKTRLQTKINYVNRNISFEEYYNMNISYNKKENINYTFYTNIDTTCEFRSYVNNNNMYISMKDQGVSNAHKVPDLMEKRAVELSFFNKLDTIKMGKYVFDCPSNYRKYLESKARYGDGSIEGNPIRDCKPGVVILYDDFM